MNCPHCYHLNLPLLSDKYVLQSTCSPCWEPCSERLGKGIIDRSTFNPQPIFNKISCILQEIHLIQNAIFMHWSQHWYLMPLRYFLAESKILEVVVSFNLCFCQVSFVTTMQCTWLYVFLRSSSALWDIGIHVLVGDCNAHRYIWINRSNGSFWIYCSVSAYSTNPSA